MNARSCTIGVDMGTTNAKCIALDTDGREVARAEETLELLHPEPGAAEQDPGAVQAAVTRALAQAAAGARDGGYTVERVGISAAMHSLLPIGADGAPLANALTWADTRAREEARSLWNSPEGVAIYERTGTPIHPMAPLPKLLWLRAARPRVFAAAARFVSLKEWLWSQWLGEWAVDASIASATGLYNLRTRTWDAQALATAGISPDQLSRLVPTTYVNNMKSDARDDALARASISPQTAFSIGASDGVLANLGVGAIDSERMVLTIGTSCAVRTGSAKPFTDPATRSFCYVLDDDRFIAGGPSNSGGIVLDWLFHHVLNAAAPQNTAPQSGGPPDAAGEAAFQRLMAAAVDASDDNLICLPYLAGERAPLWDADAKAAFVGLAVQHTGAHLLRAAIEGILFNAYWIASGLFGELGRPRAIVASGKVLEPEWIRRVAADIFGIPVVSLGAVDASAQGAVTLAEIATGVRGWDEAVKRQRAAPETTVAPSGDDRARRKYARFRRLAETLTGARADTAPDTSPAT